MKKLIKYYEIKTKSSWGIFENSISVMGVVGCGPEAKFIPEKIFDDASGDIEFDEKRFSPKNFKFALDENLETYKKGKMNKK